MLSPAGGFYVPMSRDHQITKRSWPVPLPAAGLALDSGDGVGRSHENLDATRAVVRLDRRCRRCDYGSGGRDRRLRGELVGFSLTL